MSLILDALNKSDGERPQADTGPGLQARHEPPAGSPAPAWRQWLLPGLVLVIALVVIVAWMREPGPIQTAGPTAAPIPAQAMAPSMVPPKPLCGPPGTTARA